MAPMLFAGREGSVRLDGETVERPGGRSAGRFLEAE
jgi:hypothetical protein